MRPHEIAQSLKDYCVDYGRRCTLNGERAAVTGRLLSFAIVSQVDGPLVAEYAWETVVTILRNGGNFKV